MPVAVGTEKDIGTENGLLWARFALLRFCHSSLVYGHAAEITRHKKSRALYSYMHALKSQGIREIIAFAGESFGAPGDEEIDFAWTSAKYSCGYSHAVAGNLADAYAMCDSIEGKCIAFFLELGIFHNRPSRGADTDGVLDFVIGLCRSHIRLMKLVAQRLQANAIALQQEPAAAESGELAEALNGS